MTGDDQNQGDLSKVSDFQRQIGVARIEAADGRCAVFLDAQTGARNPKGDVHGGALAALCDTAMARAVRSCNLDLWGLSTVSMTIHYLEPVRGDVVARARVVKNGQSMAFVQVDVLADDVIAVQANGVFRKIRSRPSAG
jgi:uncharacterized protein (TIGR00369 family)